MALPDNEPRNPDWLRDEIILALHLYLDHRARHGRLPGKGAREIEELSNTLRQLHRSLGTVGNARLRNTAGVYMKLMNLSRLDPTVQAAKRSGLRGGGQLERVVWDEFADDPDRLARVAGAIKAAIGTVLFEDAADESEFEAAEGRLLMRLHRYRERNREIVRRKKEQVLRETGKLACEACTFDFGAFYGDRGAGFIECHHTKPLETLADGSRTTGRDLVVLCANCHRMIHARRPWLTVGELRRLVALASAVSSEALS